MADDRHHVIGHQLLRRCDALLRIGCVVLRVEFEMDRVTVDRQALRADFFDSEPRAVFVVLPEMRQRSADAAQRGRS